jgi:hypothetical protein
MHQPLYYSGLISLQATAIFSGFIGPAIIGCSRPSGRLFGCGAAVWGRLVTCRPISKRPGTSSFHHPRLWLWLLCFAWLPACAGTLPAPFTDAPTGGLEIALPGLRVLFQSGEEEYRLGRASVRMRFPGARKDATPEGIDPQLGVVSYLIGADPLRWRQGLRTWGGVRYPELYPGIDLICRVGLHGLKSEFVVRPGGDPRRIKLAYIGAARPRVDAEGSLVVATDSGELRERTPVVYQEIAHRRVTVPGGYKLLPHDRVAFRLGRYDHRAKLVIDPVLVYSTYFGGSGHDAALAVAADAAGNVYVTGWSDSTDLPATGGLTRGGGVDAFIAKVNPAGALVYCTYLGGSGDDRGQAIAVDAQGNAYVAGATGSSNFPLVAPLQTTLGGSRTAFVSKLNAAGTALVFSSYYGGNGADSANAIALDAAGAVYVAGGTTSTDFRLLHAAQAAIGGKQDAFVFKLTGAGDTILYSTYLGGSADDSAAGLAVDAAGRAYITGVTSSVNFPVVNPYQSSLLGTQSAFVSKLGAAGDTVIYSTYLGGSQASAGRPEAGAAIALDVTGAAYVVGVTSSADFPVANAQQPVFGGDTDAFVARLNAGGNHLTFSTYLGGLGRDFATGVAVNGTNVYVAGYTTSTDFPVVGAIQPLSGGGYDAFVAKLDWGGTSTWATYLGGTLTDAANALALDGAGGVYVAGQTLSSDFPLLNAIQTVNHGNFSAFLTKITEVPCPFSVSPLNMNAAAGAGTVSTAVTGLGGCNWTAVSNAAWLSVQSGASGQGSGTVMVAVAANLNGSPRSGTVTVAGSMLVVSQTGVGCSAGGPVVSPVSLYQGITWPRHRRARPTSRPASCNQEWLTHKSSGRNQYLPGRIGGAGLQETH